MTGWQMINMVMRLRALMVAGFAPIAAAQCGNCIESAYDAAMGVPTPPCWQTRGAQPSWISSQGNLLHLSIPQSSDMDFLASRTFGWKDGATLQATMRVVAGGVSSGGPLRASAFAGAVDSEGIYCSVWIWPTGVAFSTDRNIDPGSGLKQILFDAASALHTYSVEGHETEAVFKIDGLEKARLPYAANFPAVKNLWLFGSYTQGNIPASISDWARVRLASVESPTSVGPCPGGSATLSVSSTVAGPLSYAWRKNGLPINPVSNPTASTSVLQLSNVGNQDEALYDCIITAPCGEAASGQAQLALCTSDFDCDGFVDDGDFSSFVFAYNILLCDDPAMSSGCKPDLNQDGFVDDTDFSLFVAAYNQLLCAP